MTTAPSATESHEPTVKQRAARRIGPAGGSGRRRTGDGKGGIADIVDRRVHEARRAVRKVRFAAEDIAGIGAIALRRHPFRTAAAAFGIGAAVGLAVQRLAARHAQRCVRGGSSGED